MLIYLLLTVSCFIWGISVIVIKDIIAYLPSFFLASIRLWVTTFILFISCLKNKQPIITRGYKNIRKISFFLIIVNFSITYICLPHLSVGTFAICNVMNPILVLILSHNYTKIDWKFLVVGISLLVAFILNLQGSSIKELFFVGLLIISIISCSYGMVKLRQSILEYPFFSYTLTYHFIAAIFISLLSFILEHNQTIHITNIPQNIWLNFLIFNLIGYAYIQIIQAKSIQKIGAFKTSFILSLNPLITLFVHFFISNQFYFINLIIFSFIVTTLTFSYFIKRVSNSTIK